MENWVTKLNKHVVNQKAQCFNNVILSGLFCELICWLAKYCSSAHKHTAAYIVIIAVQEVLLCYSHTEHFMIIAVREVLLCYSHTEHFMGSVKWRPTMKEMFPNCWFLTESLMDVPWRSVHPQWKGCGCTEHQWTSIRDSVKNLYTGIYIVMALPFVVSVKCKYN